MKVSVQFHVLAVLLLKRAPGIHCIGGWVGPRVGLEPAYQLLSFWFLARLIFDREDGGNMFLRNVGRLSTDYAALYPRREYSLLPDWSVEKS
jgi:hypothetical protein